MEYRTSHLTQALIHLEHLAHNMRVLQELVGHRPLWPVLKANAYGHGADIIGNHLVRLGYTHLCVAHVAEAIELVEAGVQATIMVLSATLPAHSEYFVAYGFEPVVCTLEMVESLARAAARAGKRIAVHLKVDTGMGRIGVPPETVTAFLTRCQAFPAVFIKGLMSHFACAHEADKAFAYRQLAIFHQVHASSRRTTIPVSLSLRTRRRCDLCPVVIDLRLYLRDSCGVARRFKEVAVPSLSLQVVLDRAAAMWDIGMGDHAIHSFLEGKKARLHSQVCVLGGQRRVVEPPGGTRRLRDEQLGPASGLRFQKLIGQIDGVPR